MRRIVLGFMGTLSGLVLLFSYHTSTSSKLVVAGGATDTSPSTGTAPVASGATPSTGTSSATPTPSASSSSSSSSPSSSSAAAASPSAAPTTAAPTTAAAAGTGTYTGSAVNTRWGIVQVQITVANGKITASKAVQYPQNNGRDVQINSYAVPTLNQEVVAAQGANIDTVSGATVTSDGYLQSLQSALNQAHL